MVVLGNTLNVINEKERSLAMSFVQIKANHFFHKEKSGSPSCGKRLLQDYSNSLTLQSLVLSLSERHRSVLPN